MMEHNNPGTTETVVVVVPFISGEAQSEFLEGELVFDPSDPYAVSMNLQARSGMVTWTFARELLEQGLYSPSGDGDVQVWPCLSGSGDAVVIMHRSRGTPFGSRVGEIVCDRNDIAAVQGALESTRFDVVYDMVFDWQRGTSARSSP